MSKITLKLYIAGPSLRSKRALDNLRCICEKHLTGRCEIEVIDVKEQPHLAEQYKILVTPTLIKESPSPLRRVIGDLSETSRVLLALDLAAAEESTNQSEKD